MSDLIKALRKLHEHYQETTGGNKLTIYAEAADALEATTARADELQGRYEQCSKNYKDLAELWKAETARTDAAVEDMEMANKCIAGLKARITAETARADALAIQLDDKQALLDALMYHYCHSGITDAEILALGGTPEQGEGDDPQDN